VPLLEQVLKQNQETVKIVFKNLPLRMHDMAKPAALAALAAGKQGKFWEYHDKLFAEKKITLRSLDRIATEIGLDIKQFNQDKSSKQLINLMNSDMVEANTLGITGTPTVYVNGRKIKERSLNGFQSLIDEELRKLK
jgi:protein-disulfide isomerase